MRHIEKHKQNSQYYELNAELQEQTLTICLSTNPKFFKNSFTNSNLPENFRNIIENVESIFEILKCKEEYEVDYTHGAIFLKLFFYINKRETKKILKLPLQQIFIDRWQVLYKKVAHLERENQKQKKQDLNQLFNSQKQLRTFLSTLESRMGNLEQSYHAIQKSQKHCLQKIDQNSIEQTKQIVKKKDQQWKKKFNQLQKIFEKQSDKKSQKFNSKVKVIEKKIEQVVRMLTKEKEDLAASNDESLTKLESLVDFTTPFIEQFKVEGNQITYLQEEIEEEGDKKYFVPSQILLCRVINRYELFRFHVKIIHTKDRRISIGVVDRKKQQTARYSYNSSDAVNYQGAGIVYFGIDGKLWDEKSQGEGFQNGETVTMEVSLEKGQIQWLVDKKLRASINVEMLRDVNRDFVPYFEFMNEGDSIEWEIE